MFAYSSCPRVPWLFPVAVLIATLTLPTGRAAAQRSYQATIADAVTEYAAGNLDEARALFNQAHRMEPSARTLRGLGMVAFEQKRYINAIEYLGQALADGRKPLKRRNIAKAKNLLARANAFVGKFTVKLSPEGASLEVDGGPATLRDGQLWLKIGQHELSATAEGHSPARRSIEVHGAEVSEIALTLEPNAAAPVATPVAAAAPAAATPAAAPDAAAPPASTADDGVQMSSEGSSSILPWVLVGTGVAAVVAGSVLATMAQSDADDVEDGCPDKRCNDSALADKADSAETLGLTATVLWIAGGALTSAGLVWVIVGGDDDTAAAGAHATALLAPGQAGVQLGGRF